MIFVFHIFVSGYIYFRYDNALWNRQANSLYNPYNMNIGVGSSISTRHGFASHINGHSSHEHLFSWNKNIEIEKNQNRHNQRFWPPTQIGTSSAKQNLLMTYRDKDEIVKRFNRRSSEQEMMTQMRTKENNSLSSRGKWWMREEVVGTTTNTSSSNKRKIQDSEMNLDLNLSLKTTREYHQKRLKGEQVGDLLSLSLFSSSTTTTTTSEENNAKKASTLDLTL